MKEFNKNDIVTFKCKGRSFISYKTNINSKDVREYFYNEEFPLRELFRHKDVKYCDFSKFNIVVGDFKVGVKYVNQNNTYYMFLGANSISAPALDIAIGKAIDGKIYLVRELPNREWSVTFFEIPEKFINKDNLGKVKANYQHDVFFLGRSHYDELFRQITNEDAICLNNAYEGIVAFSKLME